jgi:dolichol-phosphate mannosyltransferase
MKALIFLPTLNESGNIATILQKISACPEFTDILIIDDGSTDGTREEIFELNIPNLSLINRLSRKGIGSAHADAIQYALLQDYDFLITLDADGTHRVSDARSVFELALGYDVVIGSRFHSKNSLVEWSYFRQFLTRAAHLTTQIGLGIKHDCSSGLRCYNLTRRKFECLRNLDADGYDFFFKSAYMLSRNGYSILDLAVTLEARQQGESKMDLFSALSSIWKLFLTVLTFRFSQVVGHFRLR